MAPCWIQQIPQQNAAEKHGFSLGFTLASSGGRMRRTERAGTGSIMAKNLLNRWEFEHFPVDSKRRARFAATNQHARSAMHHGRKPLESLGT